jgi:hypothetical protein
VLNLLEKKSNQKAKFAGASFSTLSRANHIADSRRQFPLPQKSSSPHFPRAPVLSTFAAN